MHIFNCSAYESLLTVSFSGRIRFLWWMFSRVSRLHTLLQPNPCLQRIYNSSLNFPSCQVRLPTSTRNPPNNADSSLLAQPGHVQGAQHEQGRAGHEEAEVDAGELPRGQGEVGRSSKSQFRASRSNSRLSTFVNSITKASTRSNNVPVTTTSTAE